MPAKGSPGLADVESQLCRFVRLNARLRHMPRSFAPRRDEPLGDLAHGARRIRIGPEVERSRQLAVNEEPRRQMQVAGERFEYVLPRADGRGIAHGKGLSARQRTRAVRYQPVLGPVRTADHVACTRGRHCSRASLREERVTV